MIYQVVVLLLLLCSINGVPIEEFLPFNGSKLCLIDAVSGMIHTSNVLDSNGVTIDELDRSKCDEFRLSPNDDAGSYNISISVTFPFFARQFKNVYVNTNGVISFNAPYPTFNPAPFPMPNRSLIAPFMSDVDTRGIGEIYLKETSDPTLLQRASSIIHSATYQVMELPQFDPLWMLVATWYNVGHYNSGTNKTNTFQALLVTDGNHSFIVFNYLDNGINWNKGDYGTMPAQVGVNFGGEPSIDFSLPGSRTEQVSDIELHSNINKKGQFVYRVDRIIEDKCNDVSGIRIINPKTPTIINGGTMQLIGPCFNGSVEPITCVFTDKDGDVTSFVDENGLEKFKQIKGITVNQKAICPIPLFRRLGSHNVTITITSNNGVFSTAFEVVSDKDMEADVQVYNSDGQTGFTILDHDTRYTARWNTQQINKDEFNEGGEVSYRLESYTFSTNSVWIKRPIPRRFNIVRENYRNGNVIFRQTVSPPSQNFFNIYVVALVKQTANLEVMYTSSVLSYMPRVRGVKSAMRYCNLWLTRTNQILSSDDLKNCPCNLDFVDSNSDFVLEPTCGLPGDNCIGGNQCYIMGIEKEQCCHYSNGWCTKNDRAASKKLGLRCCYDSDGNYSPQQARSYYNHPYDDDLYLQYLSSDYFPQKVCCSDSDEKSCKNYQEQRPGDIGLHCSMNFSELFSEGAVCTVNTTTGLIYTNTSTRGGKFELLDGENCTVYKLTPNNNASTGEITLSVPFCVGDQEYTKLYVSTNGRISFNKPFTQARSDAPLDNEVIIAPYWTDLDVTDGGNVHFKESTHTELLEYISTEIRNVESSMTQFEAHWAFVVTWTNVKSKNFVEPITFTTILTTNGRHSFAMFLYQNSNILNSLSSEKGSQPYIGFSGTEKSAQYRTSSADNQNDGIPNCEKSKLMLRLDQKSINKSGCNYEGAGVVDRKFIPLTGGGLVTIKGPCFPNPDTTITCKFEHGQIARAIYGHVSQTIGKTTGPNSALCPLPLFARLGPSVLNISDDDGATFKFHVVLTIVPAIYGIPDVIITDSSGRERNIDILGAKKNYAVNVRNERWDEKFKVLHMVYKTTQNRWVLLQRTGLSHVFHNMLTDDVKVDVTQVSVILVIKDVDGLQVSYVSPVFSLLNRDPSQMCTDWISQENARFNSTIPSQSCPCTLQKAKQDPDYVDDVYCSSLDGHYFWKTENCRRNKGADHCMVIKQLMETKNGQQCCYDKEGLLITDRDSPSVGTVLRTNILIDAHYGYFENDYFSYLVCCQEDQNSCKGYYGQRPIPTADCS